MRKKQYRTLITGAFVFCSLTALGQESRHEIRVGFGAGEEQHLNSVQHKYVCDYNLEEGTGDADWGLEGPAWVAWLEYFYHLSKRWAVGASVGFGISREAAHVPWEERHDANHPHSSIHEAGGVSYEAYPNTIVNMRSRYYFAMPVVKYTWYGHNHFRLYSKAGLGARYYKLDVTCNTQSFPEIHEKNMKLSYQLSAVGVEVGGERMRGFAELGYGMQGIFNFGILLNL
ncbi:hypothetical protein [Prevotella sp. KH2C16]|uniref:hypothetical protein n=1 Tax=Prevotella sp. KH2C16 TaxID=1855325 RepID=UPI0008F18E3F|nr:hypothetical protein [Prevotella sp. KH2C16]SFG53158.1 hypothetical protein SAMN05216383_11919 [Prevotella sp. KH2C16]